MNIMSRLEKLEQLLSTSSESRGFDIVVRAIIPANGKHDFTHAYMTGSDWQLDRNPGESETEFEARAIESAPRNNQGFARIILLHDNR